MERFKVTVRGGDLDEARAALARSSIGSTYAARGSDEPEVVAGVDARDSDEAMARVANVLPEGCRIEGVEPWPEDAS